MTLQQILEEVKKGQLSVEHAEDLLKKAGYYPKSEDRFCGGSLLCEKSRRTSFEYLSEAL